MDDLKLLYLGIEDWNLGEMLGVKKKILWQSEAMHRMGIEVFLTHGENKGTYVLADRHDEIHRSVFPRGFKHLHDIARFNVECAKTIKPDIIYMRLNTYNLFNYWMLKRLKKECGTMIAEVPTYPFKSEMLITLLSYVKRLQIRAALYCIAMICYEFVYRCRLKTKIDLIVTYMQHDKIWGIPVKTIDNGVSVDDVPIKKVRKDMQCGLVLISVAYHQIWNGFDRVIAGIDRYYKKGGKEKVLYYVVGSGPYIQTLQKMVNDLRLKDHIVFCGFKMGNDLDDLFDKSDLAISTIGYHRIKMENSGSTLKTKEYCARGIPFVYASNERALGDKEAFALKISADDEPVDVNMLFRFAQKCKDTKDMVMKERNFARSHYAWDTQLRPVFQDYLHAERRAL